MKKSYLLSGMIVLAAVSSAAVASEKASGGKSIRFEWMKSIDGLVTGDPYKINWSEVFEKLDLLGRPRVRPTTRIINGYRTPDQQKNSLLGLAVIANRVEAVEKLLKHYYADPYLTNAAEETSFDLAKDKPELFKLLERYKNYVDPDANWGYWGY